MPDLIITKSDVLHKSHIDIEIFDKETQQRRVYTATLAELWEMAKPDESEKKDDDTAE